MNAILTALSNDQEWPSGESTPLPPMWPGVQILALTPYVGSQSFTPISFSPGFSLVFHAPQKPTLSRHVHKRTPKCSVGKQVTITIYNALK